MPTQYFRSLLGTLPLRFQFSYTLNTVPHPGKWTTSQIMKPADCRRQDTQQAKPDQGPDTLSIRAMLNEGSAHL
jgi:hypothetical protein